MELVISMCVICAYSEMIELHWSLRGAQVPGMKNEGPKESYDEERDEADSSEPLVSVVTLADAPPHGESARGEAVVEGEGDALVK